MNNIDLNQSGFKKGEKELEYPKPSNTAERITFRLQELLATTNKTTRFNAKPVKMEEAAETLKVAEKTLKRALDQDPDIRDRLEDIIKDAFTSVDQQYRQLRDMQLYLILLSRHQPSNEDRKQLYTLAEKVREALAQYSQEKTPEWTTQIQKIEDIIREASPKKKTVIEGPSLLTTHKGTALDDKIFGHIHAESMIAGSKYEGGHSAEMIDYLRQFLTANKEKYPEIPECQNFIGMLSQAKELCDAASSSRAVSGDAYQFKKDFLENRCKAFHSLFCEKVANLNPGEKTLVEIGWAGLKTGHSMKLMIEREKEGSFRLTIFNTGAGLLQYHYSISEENITLFQPFIEISGVEESKVVDPEFTQALLEINLLAHHPADKGGATEYGANDIYGLFCNTLGGKLEPCCGLREKFIPAQQNGVCTWASLLAVMHTLFPSQDYYKMVSDISFDSLCSYYQQNKEILTQDEEKRHLLEHASVRCAQNTLDAYRNKAISLQRLQETYATLKELQDHLDRAENESAYEKSFTQELHFEDRNPVYPHVYLVEPWELKSETKGDSKTPTIKSTKTPEAFSFDWLDDPSQVKDGLSKLESLISATGNQPEGLRYLEQFFNIQAQKGRETVWKEIPQEDLSETLVHLAGLSEKLFFAERAYPHRLNTHLAYANYLKALTLMVGQRIPELNLGEEKIPYLSYLQSVMPSLQDNGALMKDQNLYSPEERSLRRKALEILSSQGGEGRYFHLTLDPKSPTDFPETSPQENFRAYELRFIEEFLKRNPDAKEALRKKHPEFDADFDDRSIQIALGFCDWYGEILPPAFCALRRQTLVANALARGKSFSEEKEPIKTRVRKSGDKIKIEISPVDSAKVPPRDFLTPDRFKELVEIRKTPYGKQVVYASEADVMQKNCSDWERHLRLILTQGDINGENQHLEQQVIKTLAYFSEHSELLTDPDTCMLCRYLIFEVDHLEKVLEKNPAFRNQLVEFFERGYQQASERENWAATTFFIELGRNLDQLLQFHDQPTGIDFRQRILGLLTSRNLNSEEKTLLLSQVAASYESHPPETFTQEDTLQLLTALLQRKIFPANQFKDTDYLKDQIRQASEHHREAIQAHLQGTSGDWICNEILKRFIPYANQQRWNCQERYPLCISEDGKYLFNAETCELFSDNQSLTGLPEHILKSRNFIKVFSGNNRPCKRVNNLFYEFIDEQGRETQVTEDRGGVRIRQKRGDHWYQLSHRWDAWSLGTDFGKLPEDFLDLCEKNTLWISVDAENPHAIVKTPKEEFTIPFRLYRPSELTFEKADQEAIFEFLLKNEDGVICEKLLNVITHSIVKDLPKEQIEKIAAMSASLEERGFASFFKEYKERNQLISKFLKAFPTNRQIAVVQEILRVLPEEKDKFAIQSICRMSESGTPQYLVDLKHSPNATLRKLLKDAMLWESAEGALEALEVDSLGLSFSMKMHEGVWHALSNEYPGYYLAANQRYRGLLRIKGSLVLENEQGKRKLILPYIKVESKEKGSFKTTLKVDTDLFDAQKPSIAFDLDEELRPLAVHKEQQLYLANILLAQKNYRQAQVLLRKSFSSILPYTELEKAMLLQVHSIVAKSEDDSPQAKAAVFTALSLLPPPAEGPLKIEELNDLLTRYQKFKLQQSEIPDLTLSLEEEKKALQYLVQASQCCKEADAVFIALSFQFCLWDLASDDLKDTLRPPQPKAKDKKKKEPFNFGRIFKDQYAYNEQAQLEKALITRQLKPRFYDWLRLAQTDPLKLELFLLGADNARAIPEELVIFLRSVSHGFPIDNKALRKIIQENDEKAFSVTLEAAQCFEKEWQESRLLQKPESPDLSGEFAQHHPRKKEMQSIDVRTHMTKPLPIDPLPPRLSLSKKSQLDVFATVANQGLRLSENEIADLQRAVTEGGEEVLPGEAHELAHNIQKYWTLPKHNQSWHLLNPFKLNIAKTHLLAESAEMGKQTQLLSQDLLNFANELPQDVQEALLFEVEKLGNVRREISMYDLILFTARSRHFTLSGKNPKAEAQKKEVIRKCLVYLDRKAQLQQLNRAIAVLKEMESSNPRSQQYAQHSENFYKELMRQPAYEAHKNPEMLVFEVLEEIGLHDWQVRDLSRMLSPRKGKNPNIVLEKTMGSGKSKVYLPLLALGKADGEHLSIIIVHSSQYDTVAQAMQIKSGQLFSQVAHTLTFTRSSDTSLQALQKILEECERVRLQRHFFVVTDKTMHSLGLAFDQLWDEYLNSEEENPDLVQRIECLREILNQFKNKGRATLDEGDLLLNCRYEVVYSLGDPKSITHEHAHIVADLYRSIAPQLDFLQPFTLETYKEFKPKMVSAFMEEVVAKQMPEVDLRLVADYLAEGEAGEAYVAGLPEVQRNQLAIAFYEFKELLPIVLEKRCGEHFGYSDQPEKLLPVPYISSGLPSPTSEFSFPYALLNYTIQTLKSSGVSSHLLKKIIQDMQHRAEKELKANSRLQLKDTQGYQDFLELCGDKVSIPFLKIHDRDIEQLVERYKKEPSALYAFAKKYIFPEVKLHGRKLTSTPYTFFNMFMEVQAFTGTPWNNKTYPKACKTIRDVQSAGKTQGIIWKNSQVVHTLQSVEFKEVMKEISEIQQFGEYHAFIDVGALFNGIDNHTVATALLDGLPKQFKGILFFKDNAPFVLNRKGELTPYERVGSTKNLYIFYDQGHTTGTDFKINGKSLLSIGKSTKMRDLEQGYMRDRQAELGERVEFIVPPETNSFIQAELKRGKVGTAEILRMAEIVQERELRDQIQMGTFGQIKEVIHAHLRKLLQNPAIPPASLRGKNLEQLIGDVVQDLPWEQLGRLQKEAPTGKFFEELIDQTVARMSPLIGEGLEEETVRKELWECVDLEILPKTMSAASKSIPDQLSEQQSQVQRESLSLVQKELISDKEHETRYGALHWNWDAKGPKTYERDFYRVTPLKAISQEELPVLAEGRISLPDSKGQPPFFNLSDIFGSDEQYNEFKDIFDIEVSYNFHPVMAHVRQSNDSKELDLRQRRLFEKGQLDVQNMLICRDRKTEEVQLRLISQADTGFFFEKLAEDRTDRKRPGFDVTLYNLALGPIQSNNTALFTSEGSPLNEAVMKKIVQAKFFNGESLYTLEEMPVLEKWIKEKGVERMKKLFVDHILPQREERANEFSGSPLQEIFKGK